MWKDILTRGLKALTHGTKVLAVSVYVAAAINAKKRELKRSLLARFTVRQLNEIASRYGVSQGC